MVDTDDAERIGRLVEEAIDVTGLIGATVVIGYVFTKDEYDDVPGNLNLDITAEEVSADDVT